MSDFTDLLLECAGRREEVAGLEDQLEQASQRIAGLEAELRWAFKKTGLTHYYNTIRVQRSDKQIQLEAQGCRFMGQESLDNHELDPNKPCQCGRPNKIG